MIAYHCGESDQRLCDAFAYRRGACGFVKLQSNTESVGFTGTNECARSEETNREHREKHKVDREAERQSCKVRVARGDDLRYNQRRLQHRAKMELVPRRRA